MFIEGDWYASGSAVRNDAKMYIVGNTFSLEINGGQQYHGGIAELRVSDRLANVERKITLVDGSVFASQNNDAVDQLLSFSNSRYSLIHKLESNLILVCMALVVTVGAMFSFFKWGIPAIGHVVAHSLPHKTNEFIAGEALEFLDAWIFEPSTLDEETKTELRAHFKSRLLTLEPNADIVEYGLLFREWRTDEGKAIPNAFALPSGQVILTDGFVNIADSQDEIDSVLLHEIGHVVERHSLETVVEGTIIATLAAILIGDASVFADMGVGLATILVRSNYSRSHESEADEYAFKKMLQAGIDPAAFSNILRRMEQHMSSDTEQDSEPVLEPDLDQEAPIDQEHSGAKPSIFNYLSSHPDTEERARQALRYSACFQAGKTVCE